MEEILKQVLQCNDAALLQRASKDCELRTYQKNDILITIGQRETHMWHILSGVCRRYYINEFGEEFTGGFAFEEGTMINAPLFQEISFFGIQALTTVEVLLIPKETVSYLTQNSVDCMGAYLRYVNIYLTFHQSVQILLRGSPAAERYRWFCEKLPHIEEVATNKHIASFLGITPETLSRLRRDESKSPGRKSIDILYEPESGQGLREMRIKAQSYDRFGEGTDSKSENDEQ